MRMSMRISEVSRPREVNEVRPVKAFGLGDFGKSNWEMLEAKLSDPSYTIPPKNTSIIGSNPNKYVWNDLGEALDEEDKFVNAYNRDSKSYDELAVFTLFRREHGRVPNADELQAALASL